MKKKLLIFATLNLTLSLTAQNFVNGDLNGTISGTSSMPTSWQNVPFGDINCMAASPSQATPDLCDVAGPNAGSGINGTPFSGLTFLSGLHGTQGGYWHEGIMQNVSGLSINQFYQINFYQCVVKQVNAIDCSGSWAVYIDNTLAGITAPSADFANYTTTALTWQYRSVSFQATATSHVIKFLALDDDQNHSFSNTDSTGALRMGIDLISLGFVTGIESENNRKTLNGVYPNPAADKIIVSLRKDSQIEILSTEGLLIKTVEADAGQTTVPLDDLQSGVYFLRTINSGKTEYLRFFKL